MKDQDIRGTNLARYRGSRNVSNVGRSMRTIAQEGPTAGDIVSDWSEMFFPAIREIPSDASESARHGEWFAMKFVSHGLSLLTRLLDYIRIPYRYPTYRHSQPRKRPTVRAHLPGYMFVEIDLVNDRWQQLLRIPNVIGILGSPTAIPFLQFEKMMSLMPSLTVSSAAPAFKVGEVVRILQGVYTNHIATVSGVRGKNVLVPITMFNRSIDAEFGSSDLISIG